MAALPQAPHRPRRVQTPTVLQMEPQESGAAALTLIGLTIAALDFVALRLVSRQRRNANRQRLQERGKLTAASMAGLQSIETLKATGSESDFFSQWAGYQAGKREPEKGTA